MTRRGGRGTISAMSAAELQQRLRLLELERIDAQEIGLTLVERYRLDLERELEACRAAVIGAAVTEIAALRADLSGRLTG